MKKICVLPRTLPSITSQESHQEKSGLPEKYMRTGVKMLLRTGLVPARAWGGQAVGIAPTERLKLRRQVAAAGRKEGISFLVAFHGSEQLRS